jgi:hypothetical protein
LDRKLKLGVADPGDPRAGSESADAEAPRRLGVRLRSKHSGTIGVAQHAEETVETARAGHHEEPTGSRRHTPVRMRHATRKDKKVARADFEPIAAALEDRQNRVGLVPAKQESPA